MPVTVIFAPGKKLGIGDHIVRWQRPKCGPQSMNPTDFAALPASIEVREVHLLIQTPGFRPKEIILVTTLLDPKRYPKARSAQLYQLRWQATVVNFKHLKTSLQMEMIFAKTPEMVHCGNLGTSTDVQFTANIDVAIGAASPGVILADFLTGHSTTIQSVQTRCALKQLPNNATRLYTTLLEVISTQLVPLRPNRAEPRVTKRRPKSFPRMQQPRSVLKAKLVA